MAALYYWLQQMLAKEIGLALSRRRDSVAATMPRCRRDVAVAPRRRRGMAAAVGAASLDGVVHADAVVVPRRLPRQGGSEPEILEGSCGSSAGVADAGEVPGLPRRGSRAKIWFKNIEKSVFLGPSVGSQGGLFSDSVPVGNQKRHSKKQNLEGRE